MKRAVPLGRPFFFGFRRNFSSQFDLQSTKDQSAPIAVFGHSMWQRACFPAFVISIPAPVALRIGRCGDNSWPFLVLVRSRIWVAACLSETVARRDAAPKPTWMYSRRVSETHAAARIRHETRKPLSQQPLAPQQCIQPGPNPKQSVISTTKSVNPIALGAVNCGIQADTMSR